MFFVESWEVIYFLRLLNFHNSDCDYLSLKSNFVNLVDCFPMYFLFFPFLSLFCMLSIFCLTFENCIQGRSSLLMPSPRVDGRSPSSVGLLSANDDDSCGSPPFRNGVSTISLNHSNGSARSANGSSISKVSIDPDSLQKVRISFFDSKAVWLRQICRDLKLMNWFLMLFVFIFVEFILGWWKTSVFVCPTNCSSNCIHFWPSVDSEWDLLVHHETLSILSYSW